MSIIRVESGDHHLTDREDIPLPTQRFSEEARRELEQTGHVIYELTGQSLQTLQQSGHPFMTDWHNNYPDFEEQPSIKSEVAFNPDKMFLSDSNKQTHIRKQMMVAVYSRGISSKIPDVQAVLGSVSDYAELAFIHLDKTGKYLFGREDLFRHAITSTPVGNSFVAYIGGFTPEYGLYIGALNPADRNNIPWAVPLLIPA